MKNFESLCRFIYQHGQRGTYHKPRAIICHVAYLAIHDKFYEARDLLLMSKIQTIVEGYDVESKILFNRMMVSLGCCAFRQGLIKEAYDCLSDICRKERDKKIGGVVHRSPEILLAQGLKKKVTH